MSWDKWLDLETLQTLSRHTLSSIAAVTLITAIDLIAQVTAKQDLRILTGLGLIGSFVALAYLLGRDLFARRVWANPKFQTAPRQGPGAGFSHWIDIDVIKAYSRTLSRSIAAILVFTLVSLWIDWRVSNALLGSILHVIETVILWVTVAWVLMEMILLTVSLGR